MNKIINKQSLEEIRKSESRICSTCHYILVNPFIERCPRCATFITALNPDCSKCSQSAGCAVSRNKIETIINNKQNNGK